MMTKTNIYFSQLSACVLSAIPHHQITVVSAKLITRNTQDPVYISIIKRSSRNLSRTHEEGNLRLYTAFYLVPEGA